MILIDTSALIDLEIELADQRVGPVRTYFGRSLASDLACSTVSIGELACGSDEISVRVLLQRLRKIPVSEAIAYRAGLLDKAQARKGQRLGENDTWIAATAIHYSATLIHTDNDFLRIPALKQVCIRA